VSILSGLAALIILQGVRTYAEGQSRSEVQYQTRLAMDRMVRDIRLIRSASATDITTMTASDLRFTDVNGAAGGFIWSSPILSRWNGVLSDQLASGMTSFSFTYLQNDGATVATATTLWFIDIAMTAQQGGETLQLRTRVHPRNF